MKVQFVRPIIVLCLFALSACSSAPSAKDRNEYLTGATLWFQTAGEARALMFQTYRLAKHLLDADLKVKRKKGTLPPAIIVDVDETVLDNSPFEARVIVTGESYPKGWDEWIKAAKAKAIPGAVDFLSYAHGKGVRIFYLTNRKEPQKADTAKNLKDVGFPDVTEETMICRTAESSKEGRRQKIREKYRVVMLVGDNLNDFDKAYEQKTVADRMKSVESSKDKFGTEYLVIPNPMYGDWEGVIYQNNFSRPDEELHRLRRESLTSF
jgi:5'-nucleotidase (lipoprotein e(P4) family)